MFVAEKGHEIRKGDYMGLVKHVRQAWWSGSRRETGECRVADNGASQAS